MNRLHGFFIKFRKNIVHSKVFLQRTMSWISIANSGMIMFLVLSKFNDYGLKIYITKWIIPLYLFFLLLMLVFGYAEDRLGFLSEEKKIHEKRSPYMKDMIDRMDKMDKKLNSISRKLK